MTDQTPVVIPADQLVHVLEDLLAHRGVVFDNLMGAIRDRLGCPPDEATTDDLLQAVPMDYLSDVTRDFIRTDTESIVDTYLSVPCGSALRAIEDLRAEVKSMKNKLFTLGIEWEHAANTMSLITDEDPPEEPDRDCDEELSAWGRWAHALVRRAHERVAADRLTIDELRWKVAFLTPFSSTTSHDVRSSEDEVKIAEDRGRAAERTRVIGELRRCVEELDLRGPPAQVVREIVQWFENGEPR